MTTTVSASYANALLDVAAARGANRRALQLAAGYLLGDHQAPDDRVPFAIFKALMRESARLCHDPAFGLHFGAESVFQDISIVGLIAHASATMGEAFEQMNRFARLAIEVDGHDAGDRFRLAERDGALWIEDCRRDANSFPELTEATFARFITNVRRSMPDAPFARCVHVTHARPAHADEYDRVLQVPVSFCSDRNAIAIHASWLSIPLPGSSRYVFGIFSDRAQALMDKLLESRSVAAQVEAAVLRRLHTGEFDMARIARELGRSRSSLYRDLHAEGVVFETLVEALRHRLALDYLAGRKLSVAEVAYLVGFSDPSSFSRAFKRWVGVSPGAARAGQS